MSFSDSATETIRQHGHHLVEEYDITYVDACTWMSAEIESFLNQAEPYLRRSCRKLVITASVFKELQNCAALKYAAQTALRLIERYAELISIEEGEVADRTADGEFVRHFFFNHNKRRQLLITHDQQLATDIQNCCPDDTESPLPSTAVMTLWPDGDLITFACLQQRKDNQARSRLEEMTADTSVYLDSSALSNVNLPGLLEHLKAPLQAQGRKARILSNSLTPELRELIEPILREYAELLDIVIADPTLSETNALLGELYLRQENMGKNRQILVTDDVARANELRNRRPKCDRFPFIDFMTINKYAYLSYLKLSDPAGTAASLPSTLQNSQFTFRQQNNLRYTTARATAPAHAATTPQRPRATAPAFARSTPRDRKPAAFVPQLIGAIKSGDLEAMNAYIAKGASLRNGIITSLCQDKDDCLRELIEKATDSIDPECFAWWVTSYYTFTEPDYLAKNELHFNLLRKLITKSAPLTEQSQVMATLAERVSSPAAAHSQLWELIRLALSNGAPAAVYAETTQETLLEIATRQGNAEMVQFLQSR